MAVVSLTLSVNIGLPQGTVLRLILFLLYVNDLPSVITDALLSMYANDSFLCSSAFSRLLINTSKSYFTVIGTRSRIKNINEIITILGNTENGIWFECVSYIGESLYI